MRRESRRRNSSSDFGTGDFDPGTELSGFDAPPFTRFRVGRSRSFTCRFFGFSSGNVLGCLAIALFLAPFDQLVSLLSIKMI
jgi:hypothetical protein